MAMTEAERLAKKEAERQAGRETVAARTARVDDVLVPQFNGAIKYAPMLQDHPDWTDEQCLAFARQWHTVAIERMRNGNGDLPWNEGIPYCRNVQTATMKGEAGR